MPTQIPQDVQRFIQEHITSVEQLEVLLLLRSHSLREWDSRTVSQAIYTQPHAAERRLSELANRGFLTRVSSEPNCYRFQPQSQEQRRLVDRLAALYKQRRVAVTAFIYSKPSEEHP